MDALARLNQTFDGPAETTSGTAQVTNPSAGTFADGRRKITVNWLGSTIDASYLAVYTPAANDFVIFQKSGSSFFVLGKAA